jgi:AraC-like DNA-binding protein
MKAIRKRSEIKMLKNIIVTDIQMPVTVISPKGRTASTKNRATYGLSFCLSGQITYEQCGRHYVSTKNTAILLPKGADYSLVGNKDGVFLVINFDCIGLDCSEITIFSLETPESFHKDTQKISELFLFQEKQLDIYLTFYHILKQIDQAQHPQNNALYLAMKYIEKNIGNSELSNERIARNANISEVYLRKLFLKNFHITPKQYILDIRMQKAKQLLTDSSLSISSISDSCGFSSVYTFSRSFKGRTGISPSEFSKSNRIYEI